MGKSVMISLGDSRMGQVAEVLGNSSCVRILDLLGDEDLTVSDIAERLKMKLNTVDYNVKKLKVAGLIESGSHWWSVKGKKMPVYRVADKMIVISPRRSVAKKFLWVLGLTGAAALWLRELAIDNRQLAMDNGRLAIDNGQLEAVFGAAPKAELLSVNAEMTQSVLDSFGNVGFWYSLAGWEWFLIGAWFTIVLFFVFSLLSERRINR